MSSGKCAQVVMFAIRVFSCENDKIIDYPPSEGKKVSFSGYVLDCFTQVPIPGAQIFVEYCWMVGSPIIGWTQVCDQVKKQYLTNQNGYFSFSFTGWESSGGWHLRAGASNYWIAGYCNPWYVDLDSSNNNIVLLLSPINPEKKLKFRITLNNGSWSDYLIVYRLFRLPDDIPQNWFLGKDTLIEMGTTYQQKIVTDAWAWKYHSNQEYEEVCFLTDTLYCCPPDTDTLKYKLELDGLKDTLVLVPYGRKKCLIPKEQANQV